MLSTPAAAFSQKSNITVFHHRNNQSINECHSRGPMAHILHAGGPWKLESPRRHQETGVNAEARQANKVPGGQWGPRVVGSRVSLTAWAPKQTNTSS